MDQITYKLPLRCWKRLKIEPLVMLPITFLGLLVGVLLFVACEDYYKEFYPVELIIQSISLVDDGKFLIVTGHSDSMGTCNRDSVHVLFGQNPDGSPDFLHKFSIGEGKNGPSFTDQKEHYYTLAFSIPPDLTGNWWYQNRSSYTCWPFGLVHGYFQTEPVLVHFGPIGAPNFP